MAGLAGGAAVSARVIRQGWPLWAVSPNGWTVGPVIGWEIVWTGDESRAVAVVLPTGSEPLIGSDSPQDDWTFLDSREQADKAAEARKRWPGGGQAAYERMIAEHTGEPLKGPEHG